jgi:WD40 repeat protein
VQRAGPFVGRDQELRILQDAWARVIQGHPQFVTLLGDTGLGKTRLVQAFYGWLSRNQDAPDPNGYWPDSLAPDGSRLGINPAIGEFAGRQVAIPWLWWGVRFADPGDGKPSGIGLIRYLYHLAPHIEPWDLQRERRGLLWRAGKTAAGVWAGLITWGLVGPYVSAAISIADTVENLRDNRDRTRDPGNVTARHDRAQRDAGAKILELFRALFADAPPPSLALDDEGAAHAGSAVRTIPAVLVFDDAHWADPESLGFLGTLYREAVANGWPLLVLCTHWEREWREALGAADAESAQGAPNSLPELRVRLQRSLAPGDPSHCRELPVGKLPDTDLRPLLTALLPGVTDDQASRILLRIDGNPAFLMDLIGEARGLPEMYFFAADPDRPFTDSGFEAFVELTLEGHYTLIQKRFKGLDAGLRSGLGLASFQGTRFLEDLLVATAGRLAEQPCANEDLSRARDPYGIIERVSALTDEFRQRTWYEVADAYRRKLHESQPDAGRTFRDTLLAVLTEWHEAGRIAAMPNRERIQALELYERVLREHHGGALPTDVRAILDGILAELQALRADSGEQREVIEVAQRRAQVIGGHYGGVSGIAWEPNGRWVASGGGEAGEIILWSAETGRPLRLIPGPNRPLESILVSPDGASIAAIYRGERTVSVWDAATGGLRFRTPAHREPMLALAGDPNGEWFGVVSGSEAGLYAWQDGRHVGGLQHAFPEKQDFLREIIVTRGRNQIVLLGNWGMQIRSPDSGVGTVRPMRFSFWRNQRTLTASQDGRWIAWAVYDRVVLWDLDSEEGPILLDRGDMQASLLQFSDPLYDEECLVVYGLAFDPAGRWLAVFSHTLVQIFLLRDKALLREITGHWLLHDRSGPNCALTTDGKWLALVGLKIERQGAPDADPRVREFMIREGRRSTRGSFGLRQSLELNGAPGAVVLIDPGGRVAPKWLNGQKDWVQVLAPSPDGRILAAGGLDSTLGLWDIDSGELLHCTPVHRQPIRALALAPDGSWIASAGRESVVRVWTTDAPAKGAIKQQHKLDLAKDDITDRIEALAVSPAGDWLAVGKVRNKVVIWRPGEPDVQETDIPFDELQTLIVLARSAHIVTYNSLDLSIWNPGQSEPVVSFRKPARSFKEGMGREYTTFYALASDRDGRWIAGGGRLVSEIKHQGSLWLWNWHTSEQRCLVKGVYLWDRRSSIRSAWEQSVSWFKTRLTARHRTAGIVYAVTFGPDGSWLASGMETGKVWLWDTQTAKCRRVLDEPAHDGAVLALAAGNDGAWLASAGADGLLQFWDVAAGRQLYRVSAGGQAVRALALDPRGRWLFSAGDDGLIRRWVLTAALVQTPVCDLAMQPLPGGDWAISEHPDDDDRRRWVNYSEGALRWLIGEQDPGARGP